MIIIVIALISFTGKNYPKTDEETAKCIGEKATLYVQLGCSHCEDQEKIFGNNLKYINSIDCFYNSQTCLDEQIEVTPTWKIKGELYKGIQTIEELQDLTGC